MHPFVFVWDSHAEILGSFQADSRNTSAAVEKVIGVVELSRAGVITSNEDKNQKGNMRPMNFFVALARKS